MLKTKTGQIATHRIALLEYNNEFSKRLLEYRECKKIISTYLTPILENLDSENKLHSQYNQHTTVTGRLSSSNPINFQNIPLRSELGKKVRELFIGNNLIVADLMRF